MAVPRDLLALLPCALKTPLEAAFGARAEKIDGRILGNAVERDLPDRIVEEAKSEADFPAIVVSPGINAFYGEGFIAKTQGGDAFRAPEERPIHPLFQAAGLRDPRGIHDIIAVNPLVLLIDEGALAGRPAPRSIEDLLNPRLTASIAARGGPGAWCETTLLAVYRLYGEAGIAALGTTVSQGLHPSQMVAEAGSDRAGRPAVSIIPLSFARLGLRKKRTRVVIPAEGAIASPISLIAKTRERKRLEETIDFFVGAEAARLMSGAGFAVAWPARKQTGGVTRLYWPGWDFIRSGDIEERIARLMELFDARREH